MRRVWRIAALLAAVGLTRAGALFGQSEPEMPRPLPALPKYDPNAAHKVDPPVGGPVVPVSGSNPQTLGRTVLSAPALATAASNSASRNVAAAQTPCVQIEKRGPEVAIAGQPLRYEIIVRNPGTTTVYNVRVDEELPTGVRCVGAEPAAETNNGKLGWSIGTMEPFAERRIRVDVQTPGDGELTTRAVVSFSGAASLRTHVVQPRVLLAVRGPEQVSAGDSVPFQIQVTNSGAIPLSGLALRSRLSDGLQHPQGSHVEAELGSLGPGESRTVTLTTTAAHGGEQSCEMSVSAAGGAADATARATVRVLECNLQLRRLGPTRCFIKSEVGFELEATNPGSATANDVVVTEKLPEGFEYLLASDGGIFEPASRAITWRIPSMPAGAKRTFTYRVRATGVGELSDRATIRAARGPEGKTDGMFTVEGVAALSVGVIDLEDPIEVGGELTYEVRVINQGSCACSNIQITATAPDGLQPINASGPSGHRLSGLQIIFDPLPRLATKADAVYRIKVRGVQPGDYRFRVQMTCEQLKAPVVKEESSRVY